MYELDACRSFELVLGLSPTDCTDGCLWGTLVLFLPEVNKPRSSPVVLSTQFEANLPALHLTVADEVFAALVGGASFGCR